MRLRSLVLLLIAASGLAQDAAVPTVRKVRLTCSWADQPAGEVTAQTTSAGGLIRLNGLERAIDYPSLLIRGESVELFLKTDAGAASLPLGRLAIPSQGDDFAIILGTRKDRPVKAWLLPSGLAEFPKGGTYLINRGELELKATLEETSCMIPPEGFALLGFTASKRTVANLRVEARSGKAWSMIASNRLIIGPDQRMILLMGPSEADDSPHQLRGVIDANSGSYQRTIPLTAEPPLPDPPAK